MCATVESGQKGGDRELGEDTHQRSPDRTQTPPAALQPMPTCSPCELNWRPSNRFLMNTKKLLCAAIFKQISCVLLPFLRPADCAFCIWKEKNNTQTHNGNFSVQKDCCSAQFSHYQYNHYHYFSSA